VSYRFSLLALFAAAFALLTGPALARCSKNLVERLGPGVQLASLDGVQLAADPSANRAIITFLGHASYQIDTPQGVRAITDYNGVNGFGRRPDVVTMNNAHTTHFTDEPEDGITYVLRGWPSRPGESEAKVDVRLKDMRVWNVPTNASAWAAARRASTATRSSSSPSAISASLISVTCITGSRPSISRSSAASTC